MRKWDSSFLEIPQLFSLHEATNYKFPFTYIKGRHVTWSYEEAITVKTLLSLFYYCDIPKHHRGNNTTDFHSFFSSIWNLKEWKKEKRKEEKLLVLLLTVQGREKQKGSLSKSCLRTLFLMLFVINERKWGGEEHKMRSLLPCFHYTTWLLVTVWGNKCSNYWVFPFPFIVLFFY